MAKIIDLLLLARPDHSYSIYKGLLKSNISFVYCSFKLMPEWLKRYIKSPRVRYYSRNYSNCKLLTLFHIYRLRYKKDLLERYEKRLYEFHLSGLLKRLKPIIIHYWPYLTLDSVREYKKSHPEVKTYADVYFPCEYWVIDNVFPILRQFGLEEDIQIKWDAEKLKRVMEFEENFIVPSPFIAETYKQYYPNKNYIIIPYGLNKWNGYKKKYYKKDPKEITKFVYAAGGVTVQKGCDLMFAYFKGHPELELHIYGSIPDNQKHIFDDYLNCENFFFHKHIPKSLMSETMAKYDVGIHLSRYDAYSLAVGEMLGAGIPVIVSDHTGIAYDVENIGAGLVSELDIYSIGECVNKVRTPDVYNGCIDNLDTYLKTAPKYYEDEIVSFYKDLLKKMGVSHGN